MNISVQDASNLVQVYGIKIISFILVIIIGSFAIKIIGNLCEKALTKRKVDAALKGFIESMISVLLKGTLFITAIGMLGVQTTSFVAILGSMGLAIGLSLQGSLSNFAGGIMILLLRPFKIGDFIEGAGHAGSVTSIQIFSTELKTGDNKVIIIPNASLSNASITNYSRMETRRIDMTFAIGYEDDLLKAKNTLNDIVTSDPRVLKDPVCLIAVSELADSSVNFTARPWVKSSDYWGVYYDLQERVKLTFDEQGISIPYPQTDIHLHQKK
jgi:small conductance mechanosensitive channel